MYSEYKENEKERSKEIARKYNGKWKLTGCFNNVEFYKKIGMPQAVIDIQLFQDNPANDIIYEYNSDGDNYECTVHSKGNDPWTEKSKIGQVKVLDMGEMGVYHNCTKIVDGKAVDVVNREGFEETWYERNLVDNDKKMIMTMCCNLEGVTGRKEFVKID